MEAARVHNIAFESAMAEHQISGTRRQSMGLPTTGDSRRGSAYFGGGGGGVNGLFGDEMVGFTSC